MTKSGQAKAKPAGA